MLSWLIAQAGQWRSLKISIKMLVERATLLKIPSWPAARQEIVDTRPYLVQDGELEVQGQLVC